ncbi:MAG: uroporphyrinogen decarboxylase [Lachnospiraceae bacterium]|nr:uroporphyrinogen decarboxylase [Lachnospiraceae bacterium]
MLSIKENLRETLKKDGHPDRFVNQFEYMGLIFCPTSMMNPRVGYGEGQKVDAWGVTKEWPIGTPGAFPVHTPDKIVIKDIEHWQDYLKPPKASGFPDEMWEVPRKMAAKAKEEGKFVCPFIAPGIFEQCHNLMEIQNFLMAFYEYPDEVHDIIKVIADWELELAEDICANLHPDGLFHHDDWGSQQSTFISPAMFEDFFLDAYKQVYGYYHDHGVEIIVHHCDSYASTLVPSMIEMGINVWQGAMSSNNIPELIEKYKGQIAIMSGIDSAWIDNPEWNEETIKEVVKRELDKYTPNSFIPCLSQGGSFSTFKEVYGLTSAAIDDYNKARFF